MKIKLGGIYLDTHGYAWEVVEDASKEDPTMVDHEDRFTVVGLWPDAGYGLFSVNGKLYPDCGSNMDLVKRVKDLSTLVDGRFVDPYADDKFFHFMINDPERFILVTEYKLKHDKLTDGSRKNSLRLIALVKKTLFNKESVWTMGPNKGSLIQDKE